MTDLGEFVKLTEEVLDSNIIKAGDLFNYWGHISIIVGIKDGVYYVAESLPNFDGVDLRHDVIATGEAGLIIRMMVIIQNIGIQTG